MALQTKEYSASAKATNYSQTFTFTLRVTENSVDTVKNSSNITIQAILKQSWNGAAFYNWATGVSCTVNGEQWFSEYKQRDCSGDGEHIYCEVTKDIPHNSDGTLSLAVGGKIWQNEPTYFVSDGITIAEDATDAMELTPIARASTITAYNADIEYPALIHIGRKNDAYTHSINCVFGEIVGYLNGDGILVDKEVKISKETIDFKIPTSFYAQIPDKPSMKCTLTCCTYYGDTQIGDPQKTDFLIKANENLCAPVVSGEVEDVNPETIKLTGDCNKLIKFMSNAQCKIAASAKNEAWLTKKTVTGIKEVVFEDSEEDGENVEVIEGVETGTFVFQAYDSRQYSYNGQIGYQVQKELIDYVPLTANVSAVRTDPTSGNATLTVEGACYTGTFSEDKPNVITAKYCVADGDPVDFEIVAENNRYEGQINVPGLDYKSQHTLSVTVSDLLMKETGEATINKGIPVFDWGENDFVFHVPVTAEEGINGVHMAAFSGSSLWLTPTQLPQSFLIAGEGVLGVLTATTDGCTWQGTEGVAAEITDGRIGIQLGGDTEGILLSNHLWREDE